MKKFIALILATFAFSAMAASVVKAPAMAASAAKAPAKAPAKTKMLHTTFAEKATMPAKSASAAKK